MALAQAWQGSSATRSATAYCQLAQLCGIDSARRFDQARNQEAAMNLNQVTVVVTDVARSIRFYQRLGLQLIV